MKLRVDQTAAATGPRRVGHLSGTRHRVAVGCAALLSAATMAACSSGSSRSSSGTTASQGSGTTITSSSPANGSSKTLVVSVSGPFSGVYGPLINPLVDPAIKIWQDSVNANGGINGMQVSVKKVDNQLTPEGAVNACKQESTNGSAIVVVTVGLPSEGSCLDAAKVPALIESQDEALPTNWTYSHTISSLAQQCGVPLATLIKNKLGWAAKKIAVVASSTLPGEGASFKAAAQAQGLDVVDFETVQTGGTSYAAQATRIKSSGAQVVVMTGGGPDDLTFVAAAKAVNLAPLWAGCASVTDQFTQAANGAFSGFQVVLQVAGTDSPAFAKFSQLAAQYGVTKPNQSNALFYGGLLVAGKALSAAGSNPTASSVNAGINSIKNFDPDGLLGPVTFGGAPGTPGAPGAFALSCCNAQGLLTTLEATPQASFSS